MSEKYDTTLLQTKPVTAIIQLAIELADQIPPKVKKDSKAVIELNSLVQRHKRVLGKLPHINRNDSYPIMVRKSLDYIPKVSRTSA